LIEWLLRHSSHCYADFMKLTRITIDPGVCTGKPCLRGLRFLQATLIHSVERCRFRHEILACIQPSRHWNVVD
jgi:hypothetical protein